MLNETEQGHHCNFLHKIKILSHRNIRLEVLPRFLELLQISHDIPSLLLRLPAAQPAAGEVLEGPLGEED